jgi:hypothetical protein
MRRLAITGLTAALLVAVAGRVAPAHAQGGRVTCEVFEVEAETTPDGKIAPELTKLASKLKKPPFSAWNTFKLIKKHDQPLELKKPAEVALAPGGKMTLLLRERVDEKGKKTRLRISMTMDDRNGKRTLDYTSVYDSGDVTLIGGEPLPDRPKSTYVLGVTCKAK